MKVSTKIRKTTLTYWSITLYVLAMCLPVLQAKGAVFNAVIFASFACFILGVLLTRTISIYIVVLFALITLFDYLIFKTQWTDYTSLQNEMLMLYEFWFPVLFSLEVFSNKRVYDLDKLKAIFVISLAVYSITCFTTIIGNAKYDIPSRWLATGNTELAYNYKRENIGGFGFCYLSLFVCPMLICFYRKTKKKIISIPLVLSCVCAVCSQYFILILILAVITALIVLNAMRAKIKTLLIIGIVVLIFFIVINFDAIIRFLISVTRNKEVLQRRIQDVYHVIKRDSSFAFSDIYLRAEVYWKSISAFLNNPLTGGGFNADIGGHSEILDLMGSMGALGCGLLLLILWTIKKGIRSYYYDINTKNKTMIKLMLLALLCFSFLNPILSSREIGLAFFVVLLFVDMMEYHPAK